MCISSRARVIGIHRGSCPWGVLLIGVLLISQACADEKASVWKVRGPGATVYLGGTVHLLREKDHPLPPAYQQAYADCQRLYFEVDLKEMQSPEAQIRMWEMSLLPEGQQLKDLISKPTYSALAALLKKAGMDGNAAFDRMSPGMMAMTVTSLEAARLGARPDLGVELVFDRLARTDKKVIRSLETPEFQMRLFSQLTPEEQEELLRLTVEHIGDMEKDFDELIGAWKRGDAAVVNKLLNDQFAGHERIARVLLEDRNRAWLPVIEEAIRGSSGNTLFLVGVGHLVGKGGVIHLLTEKGFRVTQLGGEGS